MLYMCRVPCAVCRVRVGLCKVVNSFIIVLFELNQGELDHEIGLVGPLLTIL